MLTDTSLSWQSHMSIEQYTMGAAATWATPNQPLGLHPIISCCLLCSAAIVILYISHLHSRIVTCIINMYLDPSVSINCKYKNMNNIRLDLLTTSKPNTLPYCSLTKHNNLHCIYPSNCNANLATAFQFSFSTINVTSGQPVLHTGCVGAQRSHGYGQSVHGTPPHTQDQQFLWIL